MTDWLTIGALSPFDTSGGGIHHTAVIGHPPELRDWKQGDPYHAPKVHKTARIHAFVTVDAGRDRPTVIGANCLLMKHVHIGHDCFLQAGVEAAPGVVIAGHAVIEQGAKLGCNATVLPHRTIGANARIGAGSVVTKDVPAGETWAGNPARRLEPNATPYTKR